MLITFVEDNYRTIFYKIQEALAKASVFVGRRHHDCCQQHSHDEKKHDVNENEVHVEEGCALPHVNSQQNSADGKDSAKDYETKLSTFLQALTSNGERDFSGDVGESLGLPRGFHD